MKRWLAILVGMSCSGVMAYGCSGDDTTNNPTSDGGTNEAAADTSTQDVFQDVQAQETGSGGDGGACAPASLGNFQPPPFAPAAQVLNACNSTQIAGFYDSCLGPNASGATERTTTTRGLTTVRRISTALQTGHPKMRSGRRPITCTISTHPFRRGRRFRIG
jgi:hypothetical protein